MEDPPLRVLAATKIMLFPAGTVTAPAGKRMISVAQDPLLRVLAAAKIMLFPAGTVKSKVLKVLS